MVYMMKRILRLACRIPLPFLRHAFLNYKNLKHVWNDIFYNIYKSNHIVLHYRYIYHSNHSPCICRRGVKSVAVYSNADGEFSGERNVAIEQLKNQEIKVIFSVDMFNEGVDIASLDMVMFLRPTESPTVFLQQLGRGFVSARVKSM